MPAISNLTLNESIRPAFLLTVAWACVRTIIADTASVVGVVGVLMVGTERYFELLEAWQDERLAELKESGEPLNNYERSEKGM